MLGLTSLYNYVTNNAARPRQLFTQDQAMPCDVSEAALPFTGFLELVVKSEKGGLDAGGFGAARRSPKV